MLVTGTFLKSERGLGCNERSLSEFCGAPLERLRQLLHAPPEFLELLPVVLCGRPHPLVQHLAAKLWGRTPRIGDLSEGFCGSYRLHLTARRRAAIKRQWLTPSGRISPVVVSYPPLAGRRGEPAFLGIGSLGFARGHARARANATSHRKFRQEGLL